MPSGLTSLDLSMIDPVKAAARPWRVSTTAKVSRDDDQGTHTVMAGQVITVLSMEDGHAIVSLPTGGQGRMRLTSDSGEQVLTEIAADPWRVVTADGLGVRGILGGHSIVEENETVWVTKVNGNVAEIISPVKGTCMINSASDTPLISAVPPEERYDQNNISDWQTMRSLGDLDSINDGTIRTAEYVAALEQADSNVL